MTAILEYFAYVDTPENILSMMSLIMLGEPCLSFIIRVYGDIFSQSLIPFHLSIDTLLYDKSCNQK